MNYVHNIAVTCVIEYKNKFLAVKRAKGSDNFPNLWAFPGGRVEINETIIETIKREVYEETSLELNDDCVFLDTYFFDKTVGMAFLVRSKTDIVTLSNELIDYQWISKISELDNFKCIPGIYNHFVRATQMIDKNYFDSLEEMNLIQEKYINK